MPLVLEQNKLDVVHKQRSNFFNWKGQFTPEFIEYLLDCYANENSVIADPFSGSGTVLSEAIRKNMCCIGYEVNPSAYFMSKFYEYSMYTNDERRKLYNEFRASIGFYINELPNNLQVYMDNSDYTNGRTKSFRCSRPKFPKKWAPFCSPLLITLRLTCITPT